MVFRRNKRSANQHPTSAAQAEQLGSLGEELEKAQASARTLWGLVRDDAGAFARAGYTALFDDVSQTARLAKRAGDKVATSDITLGQNGTWYMSNTAYHPYTPGGSAKDGTNMRGESQVFPFAEDEPCYVYAATYRVGQDNKPHLTKVLSENPGVGEPIYPSTAHALNHDMQDCIRQVDPSQTLGSHAVQSQLS